MKRFFSRALVALVASAAVVVPGLATTAPAEAAGRGSCSLIVPKTVKIKQPYQAIRATLADNCFDSDASYASWEIYHPSKGSQGIVIFDTVDVEYWDFYDFRPVGRYTWRPSNAWDVYYDDLIQNSPTTDIRYASTSKLTVSKSKTRVAFTATGTRYSSTADKFTGWKGASGRIYYRKAGSKTWQGLKDVKLDSAGRFSWAYLDKNKREYKLVMWPQSTVWGSESGVTKR